MSSLAEMRAELRALRKEHMKPASRMRKGDVAAELEMLRRKREETPAVAAVPSARPRSMAPAVESIKKAKAGEFPVAPAGTKKGMERKTARKAYEPAPKAAAPKARMSKAQMRALLDEMTSDEE